MWGLYFKEAPKGPTTTSRTRVLFFALVLGRDNEYCYSPLKLAIRLNKYWVSFLNLKDSRENQILHNRKS